MTIREQKTKIVLNLNRMIEPSFSTLHDDFSNFKPSVRTCRRLSLSHSKCNVAKTHLKKNTA